MSEKGFDESFNTSTQFDNSAYVTPNALQLRLETIQLLENIEMFLAGRKIVTQEDKDGNIKATKITVGASKANDQGIQAILNMLQSVINPSVVQCNFPLERKGYSPKYDQFIEEFDVNLSSDLMINLKNWEITSEDYDVICNFVMSIVIPFMTRGIDNKERDSYGQSLQSRDTTMSRADPKGGMISNFMKGGL